MSTSRRWIVATTVSFVVLAAFFWIGTYLLWRHSKARVDAIPRSEIPEVPEIHAIVAWGLDGIAIKNVDPRKRLYRQVQLKLNMDTFGSHAGVVNAGDIGHGKTITVSYFLFVDREHRRFNIATTAVANVYVKAEIDEGLVSSKLYLCRARVCTAAPVR